MDEAVYIIMTGPDGVSREWFVPADDVEVGTLNRVITLLGEPDNIIRP